MYFSDDHDIQDEYHIVLKCAFFHTQRTKYINKHYYVRPSMYSFVNLMNSTKKRELYRLMLFIKIIMKEYNEMLWRDEIMIELCNCAIINNYTTYRMHLNLLILKFVLLDFKLF